jgi:phytoene dehydrogenase-like protein
MAAAYNSKGTNPDAVVIGSGPNGLAAAITIARAGRSVIVYEAEQSIGGAARSEELTLPGFVHDICSSVHAMGAASQFLNTIPLSDFGLRWIYPEADAAHPFDDGTAIALGRSLAESAAQFGADERSVRELFEPFVESWDKLSNDILRPAQVPRHPLILARFGWNAVRSASSVAFRKFKTPKARAVFAGMAGHSIMPLDSWGSSAFGILLWAMCHTVGWPFAAGGSQQLTNALANYLKSLGGEIVTGTRITSLEELPRSSVVLCDVTPRQFLEIGGSRVSRTERHKLQKYRYGPGVFKIDWSLNEPIPWNAKECKNAGTVHLGGTFEEIAQSESAAWRDSPAQLPFVLITQPSLFDGTRAPAGKHTAWGYCHVPNASNVDMAERIEAQVERFASGFKRHIIARSVMSPSDFQAHNANLIGGDISGGSFYSSRFLLGATRRAYRTSIPRVYLCSSSTPPGPGVHGLCGYFASQLAVEECFSSR